MGKIRVYVENEKGTTLAFEDVIPAFAKVDYITGEGALFEGATTNAQAVGPEVANPDDVSVFVTSLQGEELEEAKAKRDKEAEAEGKKLEAEREKAEKEAAKAAG